MTKQRSDRVWNDAVNKYETTAAHSVRSQTVPPVLVSGNESAWQESKAARSAAAPPAVSQPTSGETPQATPRMRRRVPSSRGSEFAAPSTLSEPDPDAKLPHGLGPLARAEREISQVKSSKARSSQFRETRSLARTPSARTASAHAPLMRDPAAPNEAFPAPTRGRSKSGVVTKEEEE